MTSLPASTNRHDTDNAGVQLRQSVRRSSSRGTLLILLGGVLLATAYLILGVLMIGVVDALYVLSTTQRLAGLGLMAITAFVVAYGLVVRPWLIQCRELSTAEHIERAASAADQPIVRGLSLLGTGDDALTRSLRQRAEQRAAHLAESVGPGRAYPWVSLSRQGRWLWLACVGWLVLGIVFPAQLLGVVQRAILPWVDTPAFTLTDLDPSWTPTAPTQGEDVTVTVEPDGVQTGRVDLLRLNEAGNIAERLVMTPDGRGGFESTLRQIDEPITFKLEANGRATRPYTITPKPPHDEPAQADANDSAGEQPTGGTTQYDPDAVKARAAVGKWDGVRDEIDKLLAELAEVQRLAKSADPGDAQALKQLAERIAALNKLLDELGAKVEGIQTDLPADAAASLAALKDALDNAKTAQLPPAPGGTSSQAGDAPSASDWFSQAVRAAAADHHQISQGLGESVVPTDSGTSSGEPGGDAPIFRDPSAEGSFSEQGVSGDAGPLPDAVMQQVPPSYRPLISAYFSPRDDENNDDTTRDEPEDTP